MNRNTILLIFLSLIIVETNLASNKKKKITISGFVMDVYEKPLQGVSLIVDGETLNKVTNKRGFYKIKVNSDIKTLMVYSLYNGGFEVEFTGRTKINFVLLSDTTEHPEPVNKDELIDIGYKTEKKSHASYGKVIINKSSKEQIYKNIYEMIQGKIPGVLVKGSSITIRGAASINSGTQPLFVVDGITTPSIDYINPIFVESISVLKGADTAIYGSRGANGVILIKTKKK